MIELLKGFPDNVAAFALHEHVTKADYDQLLIPDFEDRLRRHKKLRIYIEIASDLEGFYPGHSGKIRSSAGNISSTGKAAHWSPTSRGRNT